MIVKLIDVGGVDNNGDIRSRLVSPMGMTKRASVDLAKFMQPDMLEFYNSFNTNTDKNGYVLSNIMGSYEFYGPNKNGDAFPEYPEESNPSRGLRRYYKTFEQAHTFINHVNKDPQKAIGRVVFASWNPIMHRVEILEEIYKDDPQGMSILKRLEEGQILKRSMGCRVPHDECSICNHKSATQSEYCVHARSELNKIYPDGRVVCLINDYPRFFDASYVGTEADESSGVIVKVASAKCEDEKEATIEKEGPKDDEVEEIETVNTPEKQDNSKTTITEVKNNFESEAKKDPETNKEIKGLKDVSDAEEDASPEVLESLADKPMRKLLGTAAGMRVHLRPREFMFIVTRKSSGPDIARKLYDGGIGLSPIFDDQTESMSPTFDFHDDFDGNIADLIRKIIPGRMLWSEPASRRIIVIKSASINKTAIKMITNPTQSRLYGRYIKDISEANPLALHYSLLKHASLIPDLLGSQWIDRPKDELNRALLRGEMIGLVALKEAYGC